jgi:hypothetical protein
MYYLIDAVNSKCLWVGNYSVSFSNFENKVEITLCICLFGKFPLGGFFNGNWWWKMSFVKYLVRQFV